MYAVYKNIITSVLIYKTIIWEQCFFRKASSTRHYALLILLYLQALPRCQWSMLIFHCASQRSRDYGSRCTHRTAPATDFLIRRWPHAWQTWQSNYNWYPAALLYKYIMTTYSIQNTIVGTRSETIYEYYIIYSQYQSYTICEIGVVYY